jgi:hypothetical protein
MEKSLNSQSPSLKNRYVTHRRGLLGGENKNERKTFFSLIPCIGCFEGAVWKFGEGAEAI